MSNFSDFFGGGVKSVQRGTTAPNTNAMTATISSVNTSKSMVNLTCASGTFAGRLSAVLTNSTTLTFNPTGGADNYWFTYTWEVIEFN